MGDALPSLSNTQSEAALQAMLTAIRACAINIALYGADVCRPGLKDHRGQATQSKGHEDAVSSTITRVIRAAVPGNKTTPKSAILQEGGIPPHTTR